ncbi:MAG: sugar phosphate isomerase/epimerase [Planctomycetota bacterium]|jgi:hexulose-6-phosphate isomerase|nr:sugar phosphate isomerase/epimerase [Planctomycetota bacterium]
MEWGKGFSWAWEDWPSLEAHLPYIAAAGFTAIEPTFGVGILRPDSGTAAGELLARAQAHNLAVPSFRGGRFFWETVSSPDPAAREAGLEYGRRALDALATAGGSLLLAVPGRKRPDVPYEEHWELAREFLVRLGDEAAARGLEVGVENVECGFPLSVRDWKEFLGCIDHPAVGMYFDAGNVIRLDYGYPEQWIPSLASFIRRIHVKGAMRGKMPCVPLPESDVDWTAVMRAVRGIGYSGWIIVEPDRVDTHDSPNYFKSLADAMEEIFHLR